MRPYKPEALRSSSPDPKTVGLGLRVGFRRRVGKVMEDGKWYASSFGFLHFLSEAQRVHIAIDWVQK